jgi:hypothetical protein
MSFDNGLSRAGTPGSSAQPLETLVLKKKMFPNRHKWGKFQLRKKLMRKKILFFMSKRNKRWFFKKSNSVL